MASLVLSAVVRFEVNDNQDSLLSDNWLLNELLAKDYSLVGPFHTLLSDNSTASDDRTGHHPSLVVEIG